MKLFYKRNSPFARIAWITAIEAGLEDRIELVAVTTRDADSQLLEYSPVCRVPTLQTDDGLILGESTVIAGYFDHLHDGPRIVPGFEPEDLPHQELRSLAMGFMEGVVVWIRELWFEPERLSEHTIALESARAVRTLETLEDMAAAGRMDGSPTIGQITLGSILGYCDAFFPAFEWRPEHPKLVAWYDGFVQRPSMQKTMPVDRDQQNRVDEAFE